VKYKLLIDCSDAKGLMFEVTKILLDNDLNIEKNNEYVDNENSKFFMRTEFSGEVDIPNLKDKLSQKLPENSHISVVKAEKKNVIIMATKENHAIGDLLLKYDSGELNANVVCVISNYDSLKELVERFGIEYHSVNAQDMSREEHESKVMDIINKYECDYILLAKYMRILTPNFVKSYDSKIINIHHSFLPAFIGANPYKQAHERGVKIIGATAHFVTDDLDEGPIISQDVIAVDHNFTWKDMQRAGRSVEKHVFTKAVELVLDDRVFIHGNKTIIF
jgi:formyltetrahydrofolate deformylase